MRSLLLISISVALIGTRAYGQSPWQTCVSPNATATLQACIATANNDYNAALARDAGHYDDCTNSFATSSNSLGACNSQAVQMCGDDNTCLTNQLNMCR